MTKTRFKFVAALLGIAAILTLAPRVRADVGTVSFGCTNSLAAAATLTSAANIGTSVNIDNVDNVGVVFNGFGSTAQTGNIGFTFARSGDNVSWETVPLLTWVVPLTSGATTNTVAYTNFPSTVLGSAGYLKLTGITNLNSTAIVTNFSLSVIKKKTTPGR